MEKNHYDFAIIGAGAAGLHLALAMAEEDFFEDKKILIIEKSDKNENDRTWSFWEKGNGNFDEILMHSWSTGNFHCNEFSRELDLKDYKYKTIRSSNFYQFSKNKIKEKKNFVWKKEEVQRTLELENNQSEIICQNEKFIADHIFDSRMDADFFEKKDKSIRILQHFKGWFIKTKKPVFNPDIFTMMDFRIQWKDHHSFTYVLPFSETEAMIEFTLFDQTILEEEDYDKKLKQYISEILLIEDFEITEVEKGVIPMTDFPFHIKNNNHFTKIGTAGGWVKPSTGYAFKNCEKLSQKVISNIKNNKLPSYQLFSKKYRWYDSMMLDILFHKNEIGTSLFASMFKKNSMENIFKFLDDAGSITSDLKIIKSFNPTPFLKTLAKRIVR